jgi:hypothetical protein
LYPRTRKLKEYSSLLILINIIATAYTAAASHTQSCTHKGRYSTHVNYCYGEAHTVNSNLYTSFTTVDKATLSIFFSVKEMLTESRGNRILQKCTMEYSKYCVLNKFIVTYLECILQNFKQQKLEKQMLMAFTWIV